MSNIQEAAQILKQGGIVIFPTDTAYGIGCRIDSENAIEKLFTIRRRPLEKAVSLLVESIDMAKRYVENVTLEVEELMRTHWPGGLTIVLPAKLDKVPERVRGGGTTVGVRMPDHPVTVSLIKNVGVPILGPSANFAGETTPYKKEEINPELLKLVDGFVDVEAGGKEVSTVIDCSQKPWKIIRQGSVYI